MPRMDEFENPALWVRQEICGSALKILQPE